MTKRDFSYEYDADSFEVLYKGPCSLHFWQRLKPKVSQIRFLYWIGYPTLRPLVRPHLKIPALSMQS